MTPLDEMVPSPELLRAILDVEVGGMDEQATLSVIGGYERLVSWLTACQSVHLADVYRKYETTPDYEPQWFAERVGLELGVAGLTAYHRMRHAVTLMDKLPRVFSALSTGQVTTHHARLAANRVNHVDSDTARAVDAVVMTRDDWRTPSQLENAVTKAILELDPEGSALRHAARRREREVRARNEPDGMINLFALLPAEQGQAVVKKIDAHARSSSATRAPGDDRTLAQRRADALAELVLRDDTCGGSCNGGACGESTPRMHGRRPEICVTVSLSTLLGADQAPAYLEGYGWIDPNTARRIAADPSSVWRRLIVDPMTGRLLDFGRTTYRPPQDLQNHVITRDRTCIFPTCDLPAVACDLDHADDWVHGGHTKDDKLHPLCRRHHRLKHEAGWTYTVDPEDHSSIWTDPAGTQHRKPAAQLPCPPPIEPPDDGPPPF